MFRRFCLCLLFLLWFRPHQASHQSPAQIHGAAQDVLRCIPGGLRRLLRRLDLGLLRAGFRWGGRLLLRRRLGDRLRLGNWFLLVKGNLREVGLGVALGLVQLLVPLALLQAVVILVVPQPVLPLVPVVVVVHRPGQASRLLRLRLRDLQQK